jgi:hypothetical protein
MRWLAAGLALASVACFAQAPQDEKQRAAPERALVYIKTLIKRGDDLFAEAVVQRVDRSRTGLKVGDVIRVISRAPMEEGRLYEAHLEKKGAAYVPAAGATSFVSASGGPSSPAKRGGGGTVIGR